MSTRRGTLRRTSKTDRRRPSFCTTAFRIASISSSDCADRSMMLPPREKFPPLDGSSFGSFQEPSRAARPVIAASKTGYCVCSVCLALHVIASLTRSSSMLPTNLAYFLRSSIVSSDAGAMIDSHHLL